MSTLYIRYPGNAATSIGAGAYPLLAPDGTAVAPSYAFSNAAGTGLYRFGANSLGFASNGVYAGNIDSSQQWLIGSTANPTQSIFLNADTSQGNSASIFRSNSNGQLILSGHGGAGSGAVITLTGAGYVANPNAAVITNAGNLAFSSDANGLVVISNGTANQNVLNNKLATNGAQVATLTNLPAAATSGNPNGWLQITINGNTSYIPFWH